MLAHGFSLAWGVISSHPCIHNVEDEQSSFPLHEVGIRRPDHSDDSRPHEKLPGDPVFGRHRFEPSPSLPRSCCRSADDGG